MAKPTIVALGDSLTQGFQHAAITRPQWSYPAILARSFGLATGHEHDHEHRVPQFHGPGYPLDIEDMLARLAVHVGDSVDVRELITKLPKLIADYLDEVEDYHERGPGAQPLAFAGHYHNLAAWGLTVNEALNLTPAMCAQQIERAEGWIRDDFLGIPAMPMHRAAMRVFNPAAAPARMHATMIENLRALARQEPIDILLVWLGANDCLDAVLRLELDEMPASYVGEDPIARAAFNLTAAAQFRRDYERLGDEIAGILADNPGRRQVYVATIPYVTIPPVTRGAGVQHGHYFDRYHWFFCRDEHSKALTRAQAQRIDARIDEFNAVIRAVARAHAWTVVDMGSVLAQLSVKRNACEDRPDAPLRHYLTGNGLTGNGLTGNGLTGNGMADHPLLQLDPVPCVSQYTLAQRGDGHRRVRGGLFGLDHVHPSTVGYGLAAEAFLAHIQANNRDDALISAARIDWGAVILHDTLEQRPPRLWGDLSSKLEDSAWLWELVLRVL
jgi:hypothetical protein